MKSAKPRKHVQLVTQLSEYIRDVRPTLTHPIYRSMVRIPELPGGEFSVKLASTKDELEQAYRLLHDTYVEMGYSDPQPSGLRLNVYNMLPHISTLIAVHNGKVVGTVSVIRDNDLGLPMDECFDTSFYRKPGVQVAEVTGLAVAKPYRKLGRVMFPLLKFLYEYALNYLKVDVFQIATAPRREDFYRAILFFEVADERVVQDPLVKGAPMTALYLDLHQAKTAFKRAYGERPPESNLFHYFTQTEIANFEFPSRDVHHVLDPVMSFDLLTHFFKDRSDVLQKLSDRELFVLREIYRGTPMAKLMREPKSIPPYPPRRRDQRFLVSCPAIMECDDGDQPVTLHDVSESGFRLATRYPLRLQKEVSFRVYLNDSQTLPLTAKPMWNRRRREWGFAIHRAPKGWKAFLEVLFQQIKEPKAA